MRALFDLNEELDEVNFFLREWLRMKHSSAPERQRLAEPELRFIIRTLERLIRQAESIDKGIVLAAATDRTETELARGSGIPLTECVRVVNTDGSSAAYVGNAHGLLSVAHLASIIARGGQIKLDLRQ